MAELDPTMKSRLQQLIDANRAPSAGTWASPNTAPIAAPPVAIAPAPEPQALPLEQPAQPMPAPAALVAVPPAPAPASFEASLANTSAATAKASDALVAEGETRAQGLAAQGDVYQQQAAENTQAQQAFAAEQDERKADYEEAKKQLSFMNEQNARVSQVTDRRSTTQKVMGVLAIALGSIGDGVARLGGNTQTDHAGAIVQQLNSQIARDIELQKTNIDGRNKTAAMKLTELGLARTALGDAQDANEYVTSQRQLRFAAELKSQASKGGSELAKKEMLTAAAKLELDAAEKQSALQEKLTEQKYRSRAVAGAGGTGGGGGFSTTDLLKKFDSGEALSSAQMKVALQLDSHRNADERLAAQRTAREEAAAAKSAAADAKASEGKADTADQAKARMLFTSSATPAAALQARLKSGNFPGVTGMLAEKIGVADSVNSDAAAFAQEIEGVGNDILRYESGASISTQETEGLIKRSRSTDPGIRNAAIQRLLDKRAAMGGAFKQRPTGNVAGATGGEQRQPSTATGDVPRKAPIFGKKVGA